MQELQPQLGEFFRTCVHPGSLLLQIAHIKDVDVKYGHPEQLKSFDGAHRYASKFILTDGHLMVQALLHRKLGRLKDRGYLREGDFLEIKRSKVQRAPRVDGRGKVAYLLVEDCHFLLQPDPPTQTAERIDQEEGSGPQLAERENEFNEVPSAIASMFGGDINIFQDQNTLAAGNSKVKMDAEAARQKGTGEAKSEAGCHKRAGAEESEDDNFFEAAISDEAAVAKRRKVLHTLDQIVSPRPPRSALSPAPKYAHSRAGTFSLSQPPPPLAPGCLGGAEQSLRDTVTTSSRSLLPTPPFHELANLRHPPPSRPLPTKNYMLTTLAIVSWTGTSLLHKPGSPFPPKRHLKIIDPSLSSSRPRSRGGQTSATSTFMPQSAFRGALTVAVYVDAANFKPPAGTVALFRGLVMHRLKNGDVILNAYARLRDQRFEECQDVRGKYAVEPLPEDDSPFESHWFITNHNKIRALGYGSLLDHYVAWWNNRKETW